MDQTGYQQMEYTTTSTAVPMDPMLSMSISLTVMAICVIYLIAFWKIFVKAGRPGWAAIIPFYNMYVLLKIVGRPGWWLILFFIPIVNVVISIIVSLNLAKSFKRSEAFGIILLWLFSFIGYLMLGFGKSTYAGPAVTSSK